MATSFYRVWRSESRDSGSLMGAGADETLIIDSLGEVVLTTRRGSVLPSSARTLHLLDEGLVMDGLGLTIVGRGSSLRSVFFSGAAVGSLVKTELYHDDDQDHSTTTCAVCLEEFRNGKEVSRLRCCHIFHGACIRKWLLHNNSCPMCRRELHC